MHLFSTCSQHRENRIDEFEVVVVNTIINTNYYENINKQKIFQIRKIKIIIIIVVNSHY